MISYAVFCLKKKKILEDNSIKKNKEINRKALYKSGKKKKGKLKKTGNLNKTKNSYTSFMKSGNFEKEFMEELNDGKGRISNRKSGYKKKTSMEKHKISNNEKRNSQLQNLYDPKITLKSNLSDKRDDYDSFHISSKIDNKQVDNLIQENIEHEVVNIYNICLLYTSPSPRD